MSKLHVIGGGLAGSEAAWQAAESGVAVVLHEMRPVAGTPAHQTDGLAELVCSNSFRSDDAANNAVGLLHEEMRRAGSLIMRTADAHKLPAGGALAVDRHGFSAAVTAGAGTASAHHHRARGNHRPAAADWGPVIIATGPLTSARAGRRRSRRRRARSIWPSSTPSPPSCTANRIDFDIAWFQSRYDKEGPGGGVADYINLPMDEAQYQAFVAALLAGEKTDFKEWEKSTPYFEACLPIEVMAARGLETLRFGPMKPVGLQDPRKQARPHAVVQLRQDNALGTLWNMVGFQTKLKHAEQARIFRTIPGLENAQFARLGGLHRNTFINSPRLLDGQLRLKSQPHLRFAGQITGVEGYVESAAIGLLAGRFAAAEIAGARGEPAAAHHRPGRAAGPHHRRRGRQKLPADEREFRTVPAASRRRQKSAARTANSC